MVGLDVGDHRLAGNVATPREGPCVALGPRRKSLCRDVNYPSRIGHGVQRCLESQRVSVRQNVTSWLASIEALRCRFVGTNGSNHKPNRPEIGTGPAGVGEEERWHADGVGAGDVGRALFLQFLEFLLTVPRGFGGRHACP